MNNDDDLLNTNGLVSTNLFNIDQTRVLHPTRTLPQTTNDTKEFLTSNILSRDPINIANRLSQPWPTKTHQNEQPIISNTVADITENNYAKYKKYYISIDSTKDFYTETNIKNVALEQVPDFDLNRYGHIVNARYIIDLQRNYNDIYKIRLVDFGTYDLSLEYNKNTQSGTTVPEPIEYTPYILLRVQPILTKHYVSQTNLQVATSNNSTEKKAITSTYMTQTPQILNYSSSEPFNSSLSKIRLYKPRQPVTDDEPLTLDDFIEPIYTKTEMIYDEPVQNVSRLLITIYDSDANIYASMQKHHFTLEITEKINILKNTNINTKDGEVDISGVSKSNPLLFN